LLLKGTHPGTEATAVMTSTPLTDLRLGEERPGWSESRYARVRREVRAGTYGPPAEAVAEALLVASLLGGPPDPTTLAWAC
jgi:hypothetical protein